MGENKNRPAIIFFIMLVGSQMLIVRDNNEMINEIVNSDDTDYIDETAEERRFILRQLAQKRCIPVH